MVYGDYLIPQGTPITGNHWAIHRDSSYYGSDVEDFKLDRFLTADGEFDEKVKLYQFGFGRRVCPGQHVANASVFVNAAALMWAFDISEPADSPGNAVPIDTLRMSNTANSHPLPFKVVFKSRVSNLHSILLKEA